MIFLSELNKSINRFWDPIGWKISKTQIILIFDPLPKDIMIGGDFLVQ